MLYKAMLRFTPQVVEERSHFFGVGLLVAAFVLDVPFLRPVFPAIAAALFFLTFRDLSKHQAIPRGKNQHRK